MKRNRAILALFAAVGLIFLAVYVRAYHDNKWISYDHMLVYFFTLDFGEIELKEHIEAKHGRFLNQVMMSDEVVTRLINAELSLSDAIEELDSINNDRKAFDPSVYNVFSTQHAETRHEAIARYAIGKAETLLKIHNPSQLDNVLARLRMDFAASFGRKA
jgi:hypothetical protein